jgi:hypothetical protein
MSKNKELDFYRLALLRFGIGLMNWSAMPARPISVTIAPMEYSGASKIMIPKESWLL